MIQDPENDPKPRHHVRSRLMRESLLDRAVERSTEGMVYRMLPEAHMAMRIFAETPDAR